MKSETNWEEHNFPMSDTLLHVDGKGQITIMMPITSIPNMLLNQYTRGPTWIDFRQLLTFGMWVSVCKINGLLPHSNLHSGLADCCYFVGVLLAEQGSNSCKSNAWGYYCPYDDNAHLFHKCFPTQNILCQIHRCLLSFQLLRGICFSYR